MGKKGSWFSAVKKVLIPESSSEKKDKKSRKSKRWVGRQKSQEEDAALEETATVSPSASGNPQDMKLTGAKNGQNMQAYTVALATAKAAEAAVAAAKAAEEVVRLTTAARYFGKSKEEVAAIKIQSAYRGYMSRRALRAIRGLVRLKNMVQGQSVQRQAATTLRCMQTLARAQSQIRARRIRMSEENEALQRQIQQKHEKELEKLKPSDGDDWNLSTQSKEQQQAKMQHKQEAASRRERAMAYSYSHQQTWRNSSKPASANQTFMDPNNPNWGWSWLERWMAARPWELKTAAEKELNDDHTSVKSPDAKAASSPKKISRPPTHLRSPSTPLSKGTATSKLAGKSRVDEDSRSLHSAKSEFPRRHSIAGSSVGGDESLASSSSVPSYMASTRSTKARSRMQSPQTAEKNGTTPERGSVSSTKKRLSFSTPPASARRHSGPPKMDSGSVKNIRT